MVVRELFCQTVDEYNEIKFLRLCKAGKGEPVSPTMRVVSTDFDISVADHEEYVTADCTKSKAVSLGS